MAHSYVIVDDDPLFHVLLKRRLDNYPELEFFDFYRDSVSALMGINKIKPDIIFLDMHIDTFDGSDIIENINYQPAVVILTSDSDIKKENMSSLVFEVIEKPLSNAKLFESTVKYLIHNLNDQKN